MARVIEGESVNEIRALLAKLSCLRSISASEKYHSLGDTPTKILGICKRNITPFSHTCAKFFTSLCLIAPNTALIPINGAVFKLSPTVSFASKKRALPGRCWIHAVPDCHGTWTSAD